MAAASVVRTRFYTNLHFYEHRTFVACDENNEKNKTIETLLGRGAHLTDLFKLKRIDKFF